MSSFEHFLCWYDKKMFFVKSKQWRKWLPITTKKKYWFVKTWLHFIKPSQLLSADAKFYSNPEGYQDILEKIEILLLVELSFLFEKQLLMKLLFETQQTYANLFLGLMLAEDTPSRCVNTCRPVFIRVGITICRHLNSHPHKTRPLALKI